jgi:hypothetical protein
LQEGLGLKAKETSVWNQGVHYFSGGVKLLNDRDWQNAYKWAFDFHFGCAEKALINYDFKQVDALYKTILSNAHSLLNKWSSQYNQDAAFWIFDRWYTLLNGLPQPVVIIEDRNIPQLGQGQELFADQFISLTLIDSITVFLLPLLFTTN